MRTILFICEHGSAKSVVAAAHFNRLAVAQGLGYRAISRGTDPDTCNHPAAVAGLNADGLQPAHEPQLLSQAELASAEEVVTFGPLPVTRESKSPARVWVVPAISENYEIACAAIVDNLADLIKTLAQRS